MLVRVLISETYLVRSKPGPWYTTARKILVGGSPSFVVNLYQAGGSLFGSSADRVA